MTDITPLTLWAVLIAAGLCTYLLRLSFLAVFGRIDELPERASVALGYVPPAVLAALVAPSLVYADGAVALSPGNERLIAGGVAVAVAWKVESVLATIAGGLVTLWILQSL